MSWLIELFLYFIDSKHRKHITELENKDGKKRPIRKYLFGPQVIYLTVFIIIGFILSFVLITFILPNRNINRTKSEMNEIVVEIEEWEKVYKKYPNKIDELIIGKPLRQGWLQDEWGRNYLLKYDINSRKIMIQSAGSDGKFKTNDDIVIIK